MLQRYLPFLAKDNYLQESIQKTLAKEEVSFDFCIQFFQDEKSTNIENAQAMWSLKKAPLVKLATLRLPIQNTDTPERAAIIEQLSFSPAHCLLAHEPVGEINMGRVVVYDRLSTYRHQKNELPRIEPTLAQIENI